MSERLQTIRFRSNDAFVGLTGTVDYDNKVVHGVSLITGETEAEGHDLIVDSETTSQLHALAKESGQVPVYLDHGAGIKELNGYLDGFRMDGPKLRGDWHLLHSHEETNVMLERADRQPKTFGLSVAFKGKGKAVAGKSKKVARAEKLLSADVVPRPAANKDGLFGIPEDELVDTGNNFMAKKPGSKEGGEEATEPTLQDVLQAIGKFSERLDTFEATQGEIVQHLNTKPGDESQKTYETLKALYEASDEDLAAQGLTRAEVNQAVTEWDAAIAEGAAGDAEAAAAEAGAAGGGEGAAAGAGAAVAAGGEGSTAETFKALNREVIQLRARIDKADAEKIEVAKEMQFSEIENKVSILETQRNEAIELAERLVTRNEILELAVRTGTKPVKPGVDVGMRLFSAGEDGELHAFQKRVKEVMKEKKVSEGKAIQFASKENPGLHAEWLQSQDKNVIRA